MGMRLSEADIIRILPAWMKEDEAVKGLAEGINDLFREPGGRIKTLRTWDQINNLPETELDELAWELNIDWYQQSMTIEQKRAVISSAGMVMEKRGTKYAVSEVVNTAFGAGEVLEWFDYEGDPYHFKIVVNADEVTRFDPDYIRLMLGKVKPARAALDEILYVLTALFEINEIVESDEMGIAFDYVIMQMKQLDGSEYLDGTDIMNSGYVFPTDMGMTASSEINEEYSWESKEIYGADFEESIKMNADIGVTAKSGINEETATVPVNVAAIPEVQPVQYHVLIIEKNYSLLDGNVLLDGSDTMNAYRTEEEL